MVLTVLHLSDFHTGKDDYGQITLFNNILGAVRARCETKGAPDLVLITGDIANRALKSEYTLFLETFLGPLRTSQGIGGSIPILLVPGNHDVDRTQCPTTVSYDHAINHPEYFDPTPQGYKLRQPSLPRFASFHGFLDTAGLGAQKFDGQKSYYFANLLVRETSIGIVAVNSAWLSQDPVGRGTLYGGKKGSWEERECLTPGFSALSAGLREAAACHVILVLSHHPLSWYRLEDQDRIRALLGQHQVLFAHGHLHRTQSRLSEGVGRFFRALQAGAAFQTRDETIWRNRFCWYEIEPDSLDIFATPLSWDSGQNSWVVDGEAFPPQFKDNGHWRLPGIEKIARANRWVPPRNCVVVSKDYLACLKEPMSDDDIVAFFDGGIPTWRHILSGRVPVRAVVSELVDTYLAKISNPGPPLIRLVTGAGGEGKSTVLLQTAAALVRATHPWRVLHLLSPDTSPTEQDIVGLPSGSTPWLVVADDAESVAKVLSRAARTLFDSGRRDVHFLLGARDTDWKAIGAEKYLWHRFSDFKEKTLRGITLEDSKAVVSAWQQLGTRGLGRLAGVPESERAGELHRAATEQSARPEGTFFGAALGLRFGEVLRDRIQDLLGRLAERVATGSHSLLDALLLVAAPHSINVLTLTPDILSESLGISPIATRQHVLFPLGEEAVAIQVSSDIISHDLRRHLLLRPCLG